jgi:hypothetical protein
MGRACHGALGVLEQHGQCHGTGDSITDLRYCVIALNDAHGAGRATAHRVPLNNTASVTAQGASITDLRHCVIALNDARGAGHAMAHRVPLNNTASVTVRGGGGVLLRHCVK